MRIDDAKSTDRQLSLRQMPCEFKAKDAPRTFEGYGSVYGVIDSYGDIVERGAFAETLRKSEDTGIMPAMLWQHDSSQPIGVWNDITEDANGLHMRGQLAMGTVKGKEAYELAKMGALNGLSIGFVAKGWEYAQGGEVRSLTELELWEVSLVTFPANTKARITGVKSTEEIATLKDAERVLRDSGFSKQDALAFVSRVKTLSSRSDSDDMGELKSALEKLKSKLS